MLLNVMFVLFVEVGWDSVKKLFYMVKYTCYIFNTAILTNISSI